MDSSCFALHQVADSTANLRTKIMDFRGFDSSRILILRVGIPMRIGNSPESLSQLILIGRLGVAPLCNSCRRLAEQTNNINNNNNNNDDDDDDSNNNTTTTNNNNDNNNNNNKPNT